MDGDPMGIGYPWNQTVDDLSVPFGDERLLLGEIHHMHCGLDGQNDELGFEWNEPSLPAARPAKKMRSHCPSAAVETAGLINESLPIGLDDILTPSRHTTNPALTVLDGPTPAPTTDAALLPQILEIFPDISHQYVEELIARHKDTMSADGGNTPFIAFGLFLVKETIIEEILENPSYPKQEKLKRKTKEGDEDDDHWTIPRALHDAHDYRKQACDILAQEFLWISIPQIRQLISSKKGLYSAYLTLYQEYIYPGIQSPHLRLKRPRPSVELTRTWDHDLISELNAAKRRAAKDTAAHRKRKEEEEADKFNEEEHTRSGNLVECQCCYSDFPSNRVVPCEGATVHFFCFRCIRKTAETQIGMMRYKLECLDMSDCKAKFARDYLKKALGSSLMGKLDDLQQQDEVEQAGLEGLESCPFCDFKGICPPVEEDREFRCCNPSCETVSCRLCKGKSHIPKTCDETRTDRGLPARHVVEEAMSEALIRNCPKCNVKIIKDMGCNKMTCSKCLCVMCYICKKDISREQYDHFGKPPTYCDTHDDRKPKRFEAEVEQAQRTAIDKVLRENPDLVEEDLRMDRRDTKPRSKPKPRRTQPGLWPTGRQTQEPLPNQIQDILPQLGYQRMQVPREAFPNLPQFVPFEPTFAYTGPQRPLPAFEPQWNPHAATAITQGANGFIPPRQKDFLPDPFPLTTNIDDTKATGNLKQPQFPALGNYDTGTMPGQNANTPLWLDGPLYNF
ncbi:hypothetical protein BDV38DRAFT_240056 [Aspergillus pseudotamarii]|uniref:RING-type domain-containing protein n=1 Tax=Aspergillus pseudotamarii TaxID=132259 RepID=A0A5N6T2W5_ASPPS|nr:uncharacterized protein BDV38DRAFT_240056 [Aspergillus pseudotamarii]KAE8140637.1 hypothetical protein BDV38DRAFT_240056 [Aspergillus pseudotamarii]